MSELTTTYEWKTLPWRKLERKVFKLQKQIYRAACRGQRAKARRLQRLLIHSWAAKVLAVRRVTQDNAGKKTAGIDGLKSLPPNQRLLLAQRLKSGWGKASPTRRVWISKPGNTEELRPLNIPTLEDRARQTLFKLALEPQWEAKFEPNSFGFRPGRSCHDAIMAIYLQICHQPKWILDADLAKCFDTIAQQPLLKKLNTSPFITRQIRAWLRAGVMDNFQYSETSQGVPQGGSLSPLLANVAKQGNQRMRLRTHVETPIVRLVKVQGSRSPSDGDWSYWATRMGKHPELPVRIAKLLKHQQGQCSYCKLCFTSDDLLEVHHVDGNHQNNRWENLAL